MIEPGVVRPCLHPDQFVAVQIDESELLRAELGIEPALDEHEVRVPLVTRPFRDHNAASA